jgi:hypothetical protein
MTFINPKNPKGLFDDDVINSYLGKKGKAYSEDDDVSYWYTDGAGRGGATASPAVICKGQQDGSYALPYVGECLYMDVGGWFGNGEKKSPENHARHRQFGVVCGNAAALCSFLGEKKKQRKRDFAKREHEKLGSSAVYGERIDSCSTSLNRLVSRSRVSGRPSVSTWGTSLSSARSR